MGSIQGMQIGLFAPSVRADKSYKNINNCFIEKTINSEKENLPLIKTLNHSIKSSVEFEDIYNDIPMLKCQKTYAYISRSKVMVIMKGLPGSGKSTIVKVLAKKYPKSVVCSADNFFKKGNRYKFDAQKLSEAHRECKRDVVAACEKGLSPVVIDNTNVQQWEMKFYIELADAFNYLVVVLEPNTPWSKNPKVLAQKNSHGVEMSVLVKKVKLYETISPLYFGWFLNEGDSMAISDKAVDWLKKAMQVRQFQTDFNRRTNKNSLSELIEYFSEGKYALNDVRILHCTSRYTVKESHDDLEHYLKKSSLKKELAKVTSLSIVGFLVTPNTLGARVALWEEQLTLWSGNDKMDENSIEVKGKRKKRFFGPPPKPGEVVKIPSYRPPLSTLRKQSILRESSYKCDDRMMAKASSGGSAHITLGTAKGIPPVTTGRELMQLLKGECGLNQFGIGYRIPGATLRNHGNGFWGIYPDARIVVDALFAYHL